MTPAELKLVAGGAPMKPTALARMGRPERVWWLVKQVGSQKKLAAEAGVSERQVKRWCAGDQDPLEENARVLARIAERLTGDPFPWELFTVPAEARQVSLKQLDEKLDRVLELLAQLKR